jgi:hypothetical protein
VNKINSWTKSYNLQTLRIEIEIDQNLKLKGIDTLLFFIFLKKVVVIGLLFSVPLSLIHHRQENFIIFCKMRINSMLRCFIETMINRNKAIRNKLSSQITNKCNMKR